MTAKAKLPLTETVFYILLAFKKPTYGYIAIQLIEELSNGSVKIAAGTMYGALDTLVKQELIEQVPSDLERRKMYVITHVGESLLKKEAERMAACVSLFKKLEER
ncbi:PadR family transcriptional regulator [Vagococcus vulneris]|uniref:PadR family transcriptional regulator n=1 Tax=Vagococcus vulneris TaxID=1977869 RepID=UPI001F0C63FE|nr:PadR family transcriptional regulator [Vagococcus vulneris]